MDITVIKKELLECENNQKMIEYAYKNGYIDIQTIRLFFKAHHIRMNYNEILDLLKQLQTIQGVTSCRSKHYEDNLLSYKTLQEKIEFLYKCGYNTKTEILSILRATIKFEKQENMNFNFLNFPIKNVEDANPPQSKIDLKFLKKKSSHIKKIRSLYKIGYITISSILTLFQQEGIKITQDTIRKALEQIQIENDSQHFYYKDQKHVEELLKCKNIDEKVTYAYQQGCKTQGETYIFLRQNTNIDVARRYIYQSFLLIDTVARSSLSLKEETTIDRLKNKGLEEQIQYAYNAGYKSMQDAYCFLIKNGLTIQTSTFIRKFRKTNIVNIKAQVESNQINKNSENQPSNSNILTINKINNISSNDNHLNPFISNSFNYKRKSREIIDVHYEPLIDLTLGTEQESFMQPNNQLLENIRNCSTEKEQIKYAYQNGYKTLSQMSNLFLNYFQVDRSLIEECFKDLNDLDFRGKNLSLSSENQVINISNRDKDVVTPKIDNKGKGTMLDYDLNEIPNNQSSSSQSFEDYSEEEEIESSMSQNKNKNNYYKFLNDSSSLNNQSTSNTNKKFKSISTFYTVKKL